MVAYRWHLQSLPGLGDAERLGRFHRVVSWTYLAGFLGLITITLRSTQPAHLAVWLLTLLLAIQVLGLNLDLLVLAQEAWRHQPYSRKDRIRSLASSHLAVPAIVLFSAAQDHMSNILPSNWTTILPYLPAIAIFSWLAYNRSRGRVQQIFPPLEPCAVTEHLDRWAAQAELKLDGKKLIETGSSRLVDIKWLNDATVGVTDGLLELMRPAEQEILAAFAVAYRVEQGPQGAVGVRIPWGQVFKMVLSILAVVAVCVVLDVSHVIMIVIGIGGMMAWSTMSQKQRTSELLQRVDRRMVEWVGDPPAYYRTIVRTGICNLNPRLLPGIGLSPQLSQRLGELAKNVGLDAARTQALQTEFSRSCSVSFDRRVRPVREPSSRVRGPDRSQGPALAGCGGRTGRGHGWGPLHPEAPGPRGPPPCRLHPSRPPGRCRWPLGWTAEPRSWPELPPSALPQRAGHPDRCRAPADAPSPWG